MKAQESRTDRRLLPTKTKLAAGGFAIVAALSTVTGCGDGTVNPNPVKNTSISVATYQGRDLKCITYKTSYKYDEYECDFDAFYADPNYVAPTALPRVDTAHLVDTETIYDGKVLHCLVFGTAYRYPAETCDFPRYHKENP